MNSKFNFGVVYQRSVYPWFDIRNVPFTGQKREFYVLETNKCHRHRHQQTVTNPVRINVSVLRAQISIVYTIKKIQTMRITHGMEIQLNSNKMELIKAG